MESLILSLLPDLGIILEEGIKTTLEKKAKSSLVCMLNEDFVCLANAPLMS